MPKSQYKTILVGDVFDQILLGDVLKNTAQAKRFGITCFFAHAAFAEVPTRTVHSFQLKPLLNHLIFQKLSEWMRQS